MNENITFFTGVLMVRIEVVIIIIELILFFVRFRCFFH